MDEGDADELGREVISNEKYNLRRAFAALGAEPSNLDGDDSDEDAAFEHGLATMDLP
jgi:hypothetical protein